MNGQTRNRPHSPLSWAQAACDSLMARYTPPELPPANRWHYHQGVFLVGMLRLWERTGEEKYYRYVRQYVDYLIDEHGNFYFARDELDAIQAGLLLLPLYRRTGAVKYKIAAEKLRNLFGTLNKTSEGGYWHKDKYPHQMWLDGLYMGGVFAAAFAAGMNEPEWYERVLIQESLMRRHMKDEETGLLYHAWDESRKAAWADPQTGCSPEFWGRSVGWYGLAVADILDFLPRGMGGRDALTASLRDLAGSLIRFQDSASGLWYQVVDKGDRPDNWLETSCTALFVYTIAKSVAEGYTDEGCLAAARKGFDGLIGRMYFDEENRFVMPDICVGTSAGDYRNYVTRPVCENDLHGVGAFVMACLEIDRCAKGGIG